jgi:hypothetical protein
LTETGSAAPPDYLRIILQDHLRAAELLREVTARDGS